MSTKLTKQIKTPVSIKNREDIPYIPTHHHNELLEALKGLRGQDFCQVFFNSGLDINEILVFENHNPGSEFNDADPYFTYDFSTALSIACRNEDDDAVFELLRNGAHATRYVQLPDGSTKSCAYFGEAGQAFRSKPDSAHSLIGA